MLGRLAAWFRRTPRTLTIGQPEAEVLAALELPGCPLCHLLEGSDRSYFFWFANESYSEPEVLDELTASLGFCPAHGQDLVQGGGERAPLAMTHHVVVRRLRAIWQSERRRRGWESAVVARGGRPATCPACRARDDRDGRAGFFLAKLLDDPRLALRYGHPGLLCWPHLRAITPGLGDRPFERLVRVHEAALAATRADPAVACSDDLARRALRLVAGDDRCPAPLPLPDVGAEVVLRRDPVAALEQDIGTADACPVCLEVARARAAWTTWLDAAARRPREAIADLLPTCPEHLWATFHTTSPQLRLPLLHRALEVALVQLGHARRRLGEGLPAPNFRRPLWTLGHLLEGRRPLLRAARHDVVRDTACPLCRRLAGARDRTLLLLFALLEGGPQRRAFEAGYGLCLRHYGRALALGPRAPVRTLLREVEAARLACLEWELAEFSRKSAWQARPEPKGAEQLAPLRAIERFSGTLGAPLTIAARGRG